MRDRLDQTEFVRSSSSSFTFVQGASDGLIPVVISEEKCTEIGLPITIIKKAGHMAHLEQTEEVRRLLLEVCLK
jgi:pimeloyl-ACP methyl ester carboxylesterase